MRDRTLVGMRLPPRHLGLGAVVMSIALGACGTQRLHVGGTEAQAPTTTAAPTQGTSAVPTVDGPLATTTSAIVPPPPPTTTARPVPSTTTTTATATVGTGSGSGVTGVVLFSPVCPVERVPPEPGCAPRPGVADVRLLLADARVAVEGRSGADGRFTLVARPGRYNVAAMPGASGPGRGCQADPPAVTVVAASFATVTVTCDTGIR